MADLAAHYIELRLTQERLDPTNLLPMSSVAIHTINEIVYIKKASIAAYSIEVFGSVRISELIIAFGEARFLSLLEAAKTIILRVLSSDKNHMYSLGMDRFLCIAEGITYDRAQLLEELIKQELSKEIELERTPMMSTPQIGLAFSDASRVNPSALIRMAISAMEDARKYSNHIAIYNEQAENKIIRRVKFVHDFTESLNKGDLSIHYQPQICLTSGIIKGAEALIRWQHPTIGNIPPSEFIPELENTNLVHRLTDWLIDTVVCDMERLAQLDNTINMSINVSPKDFQQENWVDKLKQKPALLRIAGRIHFELTETTAISNLDSISLVIKELKNIGIGTHIHDFGAGHCTLT